jgi:integrase
MARKAVGVSRRGKTGPWRARYYDAAGNQHERLFDRWEDARDWRQDQVAAVAAGTWVAPRDGRITFKEYAERWRQGSGLRAQSADTVESRLRLHAYPTLGDRPLADLRHSELRAWVSSLERSLSPWTVYGVHSIARTVLNAAVADRLIARTPFERIPLESVRRPAPIVPMTVAEVRLILDKASRGPYRALFALAAATGLRGGELRGLDLGCIDFLRRTVAVERQLVKVVHPKYDGKRGPAWGPPKTARSRRTLDVPQWALDEVSAHLARRPAVEITLPVVDTPRVESRTGHLVFTTAHGRPISGSGLAAAWDRTIERAGVPKTKGQGVHALRHHVASLLIDARESVKVVQAQLGHATAAETWDTYSHLFPDTEGRVRGVLQAAWGATADVEDEPAPGQHTRP